MNENIILQMIASYLNDEQKLTYSEFDVIFSMLSEKEKTDAEDILKKNGICVVDESEDNIQINEHEEDPEEFEVLYGDEIFASEKIPDNSENKADDVYNYLTQSGDYRLTNEGLLKLIKQGSKQAIEDFCRANYKLVYKYASIYSRKYKHKLSLDDLIQAGMIGMMKAVDRFDFNEGTSFSTYAVWWIRQSIIREIYDTGFTIRIPVHMMEKISRVNVLDAKYGDIGDMDEKIKAISLETGYPEKVIKECYALRQNYIQTSSLDVPVGEGEDIILSDMIEDHHNKSVEELLSDELLSEELFSVLDTLKPREKEVICLRFGLGNEEPHTLEEVGQIFGVTRERIRQIEAVALRKLQHPMRRARLNSFKE